MTEGSTVQLAINQRKSVRWTSDPSALRAPLLDSSAYTTPRGGDWPVTAFLIYRTLLEFVRARFCFRKARFYFRRAQLSLVSIAMETKFHREES